MTSPAAVPNSLLASLYRPSLFEVDESLTPTDGSDSEVDVSIIPKSPAPADRLRYTSVSSPISPGSRDYEDLPYWENDEPEVSLRSPLLDRATPPLADEASSLLRKQHDRDHATPAAHEVRKLLLLSWPIVISYVLQQSINMASVFSLGHLGATELAASALGNMFNAVTGWALGMGMATALDTLGAQSYTGAADPHTLGLHMQRAILFMLLLSIPIATLWWHAESVLLSLNQEAEVARLAGAYIRWSIPSIIPYLVFECLKKFLQSQGIMRASTLILAVASPLNALTNYLLVWSPTLSLGFIGAPIATSITYWLLLLLGILYIRFMDGSRAWGGWSRRALSGWWPFIRLGVPGVIMICSEWWAFEVVALAASYLGTISLAAQSVMLTTSSTFYMIPLGLSIAASNRIGNLLGAGRPRRAHLSSRCAVILSCGFALLNTLTLLLLRHRWGHLFNSDPAVIALVAKVLPIVALFQLADGISGVCGGILRGIGRQKIGAIFSLSGYYLVALPLGALLTFRLDMGLYGLWWGLCGALIVVALGELYVLYITDWHEEERLCRERINYGSSTPMGPASGIEEAA